MDDTGNVTIERKQIISNFKENFECLLNWPTVGHDLDLNMNCYTAETDRYPNMKKLRI